MYHHLSGEASVAPLLQSEKPAIGCRNRLLAFSLIELLVVIAIISVLAALLFPAFASARERSRQTACLSNARQLGMAVANYAEQYDECLPPSTNYEVPPEVPQRIWTRLVLPYVGSPSVFTCPSAADSAFATDWSTRGAGSIGYTTLTAYDPTEAEGFTDVADLTMLTEPARIPLFGDTPSGPTSDKYRGYVFDPYNGDAGVSDPKLGTPLIADRDLVQELNHLAPARLKPLYARHFATGRNTGLVTLIFADGHAMSYSAAAILAQSKGANLLWRFR